MSFFSARLCGAEATRRRAGAPLQVTVKHEQTICRDRMRATTPRREQKRLRSNAPQRVIYLPSMYPFVIG